MSKTKIIGISGKKRSGKSSTGNLLVGYIMKQNGIIDTFDLSEDGDLYVPTQSDDGDREWGILDMTRVDYDFREYMSAVVWPYVKVYNMADTLKASINEIFGVPLELMYGTTQQKDMLTHISWNSFMNLTGHKTNTKNDVYMTVRQLMQNFGDVCRTLDKDCFVRKTIQRINYEEPEYAVVADCRFRNEVEGLKNQDAVIIKLLKTIDEDDAHGSETGLDDAPPELIDIIIDNSKMTIVEKNQAVLQALKEEGFFAGKVVNYAKG